MKRIVLSLFSVACAVVVSAQIDYTPVEVEYQPWERGKTPSWRKGEARVIDHFKNYTPVKTLPTNVYGSPKSGKLKATGFFRVEKIDGRWWNIDPDGYKNIQTAVNSIKAGGSERNKAAFEKLWGDDYNWLKATNDSLRKFGFYTAGSWSDYDAIRKYNEQTPIPMIYTPILNVMSAYGRKRGGTYQRAGNIGYPNQCIFVFDPEFEKFANEYLAEQTRKYKKDRNCYGYFSDNEMPLGKANLEGYLKLPDGDPGRLAAETWLKEKGIESSQIDDDYREEFAGVVAERYYRIVSSALKKVDPDHLYLGSRLHGGAKKLSSVIRAAGKYCDVISINYYGDWTPNVKMMKIWEEEGQRPFIITEFYTKGMDAPGLANTTGAGMNVRTQRDRGLAYQHFTLGLIESKACVGWHFFKYIDNDPTAKGVDPSNIDSNKGILDNDYRYYQPLVKLMQQMHLNVYQIVALMDKK